MNPDRLLLLRPHPAGGWDVASEDEPSRRAQLWQGAHPDRAPQHPSVARPRWRGTLDGQEWWLESTPPGPRLAELELGAAARVAVLIDAAQALRRLHDEGLVHGRIDEDHLLVDGSGRARLIGPGRHGGTVVEDVEALQRLVATGSSLVALPTQLGPPDLGALLDALTGWLAITHPTWDRDGLGRLAADQLPAVPDEPDRRAWRPERVASVLDESSPLPLLGSVAGEGVFDEATATGLAEVTRERTREVSELSLGDGARLQLLARLLAPVPGDPQRFAAAEGRPSQTVKKLVADEPLDVLPLPDDLPLGGLREPTPLAPLVREKTDTVPVRRDTVYEEVDPRILRLTVLVAILSVALVLVLLGLLLR